MGETALRIPAQTFVSIVRALKHMTIRAIGAFAAVSEAGEGATDWRARVDANVGIPTVVVRAVSTEEVKACWNTMGVRGVGKVTTIAQGAVALQQEILADCKFVKVMYEPTVGAFGTRS
jgi:signal recognition particle GTPase